MFKFIEAAYCRDLAEKNKETNIVECIDSVRKSINDIIVSTVNKGRFKTVIAFHIPNRSLGNLYNEVIKNVPEDIQLEIANRLKIELRQAGFNVEVSKVEVSLEKGYIIMLKIQWD